MSRSEVLYAKGMNTFQSESDDDDQWDDKKLNDAYDKALRVANIEVAKRVAMSTNTPSPSNDCNTEPVFMLKNKKKTLKSAMKKDQASNVINVFEETPKEKIWQAGMPCRLVFCEDGLEYEAAIVKFVDNDNCIVRYLGYENQEMVSLDVLMPSHGKEARARQIVEAQVDQLKEGSLSPNVDPRCCMSPNPDERGCSDPMPSPDSNDRTSQKKKKPSNKKKRNQARNMNMNGFEFPEIPPMPNLSVLTTQLASAEIPMPPPPMAFSSAVDRSNSDEQAISSMLISWYMSGYYTGLYQGMKRAKEGRRN